MRTTVRIESKGQLTLPPSVRRQAGLKKGDLVHCAFQSGTIVITPKQAVDEADDEYTPAQWRIIDARIKLANADIKAGRLSRPLENHDEFIADLHKAARRFRTS